MNGEICTLQTDRTALVTENMEIEWIYAIKIWFNRIKVKGNTSLKKIKFHWSGWIMERIPCTMSNLENSEV